MTRRRMGGALAAVLCAAGFAVCAAPASAASYHVYACRIPVGPNAGAPAPASEPEVLLQSNSPTATTSSTCGTRGGALTAALRGDVAHARDFASIIFTAPTELGIAALTVWRDVRVQAGVADAVPRYDSAVESGCDLPCVKGDASSPLAPVNRVGATFPAPQSGATITVSCNTTMGMCPATADTLPQALVRIWAADVLVADNVAPTATNVRGPLLTGGTVSGPQQVFFDLSDAGSGVGRGEDRRRRQPRRRPVMDSNGGSCADLGIGAEARPAYLLMRPCKSQPNGVLTLNTDALTPGAHAIEVRVLDAAGNETTVVARSINVVGTTAAGLPGAVGAPNGTAASRAAKPTSRCERPARDRAPRLELHGPGPTLTGTLDERNGRIADRLGESVEVLARQRRLGRGERPASRRRRHGADGTVHARSCRAVRRGTITVRYIGVQSATTTPAATARDAHRSCACR